MSRILPIALGLLAAISPLRSPAQVAASGDGPGSDTLSVAVVAYWEVGDEHVLEVRKAKIQYEGDSLTTADSSSSLYRVSVLDATDSTYTMRWEGVEHATTREVAVTFDASLLERIENEGILYETDELGRVKRLINADVLVQLARATIDSLLAREDSETAEKARAFLATFLEQETLELRISEEIRTFHFLNGYAYDVGVEHYVEDYLPNMFGGEPILTTGHSGVVSIDSTDFTLVHRMAIKADPEQFKRAITSVLKAAAGDKAAEADAQMQQWTATLSEESDTIVDYDSGWLLNYAKVRTVDMRETPERPVNRVVQKLSIEMVE